MNTVLIARFKSKKEATTAAKAMKKLGSEVGFMNEEEFDDAQFAKLIDEGMKERGSIPLEKFLSDLDNKIKKTSK